MSRFEAKSPLIAILYDASSDVAPLMRRIVACLTADGLRCAGFVQRDVERPGRSRCDMLLENIATGLRLPISEDRGPGARGCRLDEDALGRAITAAIVAISQAPDVLVLNKFGKSESEGRGSSSQRYIVPSDRVVMVDDFLSNGRTAVALIEMAREAGAQVLCASFIVEKRFQQGHAAIEALGVPLATLAQVEALENGRALLTQPAD